MNLSSLSLLASSDIGKLLQSEPEKKHQPIGVGLNLRGWRLILCSGIWKIHHFQDDKPENEINS